MKATLELESGQVFEGACAGGKAGDFTIVFNTSMTGVTELLTDPSSMGQALVLTYPMIGNCGVSLEDFQSDKPQIAALIVSEISEIESNFRSEDSLKAVLERYDIPIIAGIDTRSLVRLLRSNGGGGQGPQQVSMLIGDKEQVSRPLSFPRYQGARKTYTAENAVATVAVPDTGLRRDLARALVSLGVSLEVFSYGETIEGPYDGYLLPGGPGDPAGYDLTVIKQILQTGKPILAAGLGHQLLALANGYKTIPLSPGHRGANIPVRDTATGQVLITTQNHGYTVDVASGSPPVRYVNVNDGTVEGVRWRENILSIQFLPDTDIFSEYIKLLKR